MYDKIGFIGAGQMAFAMVRGILSAGIKTSDQIYVSDNANEALTKFKDLGVKGGVCNTETIKFADILVVSVKPNTVPEVCKLVNQLKFKNLVVSICAGVPISDLLTATQCPKIIRVMPNICCLVGSSASAYCGSPDVVEADFLEIKKILDAVGMSLKVAEKDIDAVTGVSGSGPAYAFTMIEAMADGGVMNGLTRDVATRLAAQTLLGAAKMVLESDEVPAAHREKVASAGGTTIVALAALERHGFRNSVITAVNAAVERSKELSK